MDGVDVEFEEGALYEIAKIANLLNAGARGLRSVMEEIMTDIMYEAPLTASKSKSKVKIVITKEMVEEKTNYKFKNVKKVV